jgi:hypothetical protein
MKDPTPDSIELLGGALCLDLANSTDWDSQGGAVEPEHNDVLLSADMLASWARHLASRRRRESASSSLPPTRGAGRGQTVTRAACASRSRSTPSRC